MQNMGGAVMQSRMGDGVSNVMSGVSGAGAKILDPHF